MSILDKIKSKIVAPIVKYLGGSSTYTTLNNVRHINSDTSSRTQELAERQEMYSDTFVRGIIRVFVARALGAVHENTPPFILRVKEGFELDGNTKKLLEEEFKYISKITSKHLYEMVEDSEALGDGFCKLIKKENKGVTKIVYNYSTKPFFVVPISSNFGDIVSYKILINHFNTFVSTDDVGHINAPYNGTMKPNLAQDIDNMNCWVDDKTYFEDFIYGGCLEDMLPKYRKYRWSLESLFNARVSSSTIQRFITHNLDNLTKDEAEALQKNFTDQLKKVGEEIKRKSSILSPIANIITTYIPTLGQNNKNSIQIQTENPTFNLSPDDALFHIKDFIAGMGYHLGFTPYADNTQTGKEDDLQIDTRSSKIRKSVTEFIYHVVDVHFRYKFKQKINLDYVEVVFNEVTNKTKLMQEMERLDSITNTTSVVGLVTSLKESGIKSKNVLYYMLDNVFKEVEGKEKLIDELIEDILSGANEEE